MFHYYSDKPKCPQNLEVKEVTKEYVILTWNAPEDNGGTEILNYVIEKRGMIPNKNWSYLCLFS